MRFRAPIPFRGKASAARAAKSWRSSQSDPSRDEPLSRAFQVLQGSSSTWGTLARGSHPILSTLAKGDFTGQEIIGVFRALRSGIARLDEVDPLVQSGVLAKIEDGFEVEDVVELFVEASLLDQSGELHEVLGTIIDRMNAEMKRLDEDEVAEMWMAAVLWMDRNAELDHQIVQELKEFVQSLEEKLKASEDSSIADDVIIRLGEVAQKTNREFPLKTSKQ